MELRHLRYLVAVSEASSFSGAAQQLGVAQPALTRQLHELERELGAELFVSGARRATLTPAGEAAVQVSHHVLDELHQAIERVRLVQQGLAGRCVLAVSRGPMMAGMPARLVQLARRRCPDVKLEIIEGEFSAMWQAIADGIVDVGLGQPAPKTQPALVSETQGSYVSDCALLNANHPLSSRASIRLEELRGLPFIWIGTAEETEQLYVIARTELLRRGVPAEDMRLVPGTEALISIIQAGRGWSGLPRELAGALPAGSVAVPFDDFSVPIRLSRIWRRADHRPVTRTVIDLLRALEREQRDSSKHEVQEDDGVDATFIPPRLDLRHFRTFVRVVEAGSVGKAAEELGLSQPALSRQMRDLEYDVGVPLLEREARGARPTEAGDILYKDAHDVLAAADGMKASVERAQRGATGQCIVGARSIPPVQQLVTYAIRTCESRYASMEIVVTEVGWAKLASALADSTIDLGVGCGPQGSRPVEGIRRIRLGYEPLDTALVSDKHVLRDRSSIELEELEGTPLFVVPRSVSSVMYDRIMVSFAEHGVSPTVDATYDGIITIWSMVAAGLGWCLGTHSQRSAPPPGTVPLALNNFAIPWDVELLHRMDEARAPVLAVIDAIRQGASERGPVPAMSVTLPLDTPKVSIS